MSSDDEEEVGAPNRSKTNPEPIQDTIQDDEDDNDSTPENNLVCPRCNTEQPEGEAVEFGAACPWCVKDEPAEAPARKKHCKA